MKSIQFLFRTVALSLLFAGTLAQAAQVTGTVTNKTTGKPAVGDTVVLVDVQAGMGEVAHATTDARGHYALNEPGSGIPGAGDPPGRGLLHRRAAGQRAGRHHGL